MNATIRKALKVISFILFILSLFFIYQSLSKLNYSVWESINKPTTFVLLLLFGIFYSFNPFLTSFLWKLNLEFISRRNISYWQPAQVYIKANIAKYLPGSIMHYVGRTLLSQKYGFKNSETVISSFLEIFLSLSNIGLLLSIFLITGLYYVPASVLAQLKSFFLTFDSIRYFFFIAAIATLVIGCASILLLKNKAYVETISNNLSIFFSKRFSILFLKSFAITIVGFFLNGFLFILLAKLIFKFDFGFYNIVNLTSCLSIAEFFGIFSVGIPAGIGLKESVNTIILTTYGYTKEQILLTSIGVRIASIIGDLLAFLFAIIFKNNLAEIKSNEND